MKLALTLAAGLMAASSMAFAADNNGGKNDKNQDPATTGSVNSTDRFDPPDENTVEACKTAPADDVNCKNALSR